MKIRSDKWQAASEMKRFAGVAYHCSPLATRGSSLRSGVALVITLIMIAVITFLAITFLAIARRERGQVTTTTDQNVARFAADSGVNRATAELIARIIADKNIHAFGLLVSTNYYNPFGFDTAPPADADIRTNVNFDYTAQTGGPLNPDNERENLTHLLYDPRPPVFVTNRFYGSNEFRFYLDLDRNGRFTPTGTLVVTNEEDGFYDANGQKIGKVFVDPRLPLPSGMPGVLSQFFNGDPQFIGILERPEFPHSSSNRFVARVAWIILPQGKTLDINFMHNHAKAPASAGDGFLRNQGVGTWELNLAGFLHDLNTNAWGGQYQYNTNNVASVGVAFEDARSILRYRQGVNTSLMNVQQLYGGPGASAFSVDNIDGYSTVLMTDYRGLFQAVDPDLGQVATTPWSGADNPSNFWTAQDLFDLSKTTVGAGGGSNFVDRLKSTFNGLSSYDQTTYYRMLEQLGTESDPEPDSKLNVNYVNVGGFYATNFVSWTNDAALIPTLGRRGSELFFSNAVDRLVRRYSGDWLARSPNTYSNAFFPNQPKPAAFGADHIPVFVNGQFVYTPSLNRQLQLAANIWDAINPRYFPGDTNAMPTVFRPRFKTEGSDVYITDFVQVDNANQLNGLTFRDLSNTNIASLVQPDDLIFGVPLIIGARKGLPNFNEFSSEVVIQVTRKLELVKSTAGGGGKIVQTNQMYIIGISNVFGGEFWNSYSTFIRKSFPRQVDIGITNFYSMEFTNDYGFKQSTNLIAVGATNMTSWVGWDSRKVSDNSFIVPMRSNHVILPDSVYRQGADNFVPLTDVFERPSGFGFPLWGITVTNRVVAIIKDRVTGAIIDYVQLNGMTMHHDIGLEIAQAANEIGFNGVWATNAPAGGGGKISSQPGVIQQIQISKGEVEFGGNWENNGLSQPQGATRDQAIANFLAFFEEGHTYVYQPGNGNTYVGTNSSLVAIAPFTPTRKWSVPMIWQANDPLVHYTSGDMEYLERSGQPTRWTPPSVVSNTVANLGRINARYEPWGGYPFGNPGGKNLDYLTAVKDPGVRGSDSWQFPTNRLPTLGWLGRVHRGTPWQTVYLKSMSVFNAINGKVMKTGDWPRWTGNRNEWVSGNEHWHDSIMTRPEEDRAIFDLFTTALNENATRGQLPINQTGLAAWSAVFSGMIALTNSTPDQDVLNNFNGPAPLDPAMFTAIPIDPAGIYDPANSNSWPAIKKIVDGINRERALTYVSGTNTLDVHAHQSFQSLGEILSVPELTDASPFLNFSTTQMEMGLNDAVVEWLPQQMLSLVRAGEPRFVVYAYGQTLKPANRSIQTSGPYFGVCTNYQITAEVVMRAVIRVEGGPENPRAVVESYNVLPPE